LYYCYIVLYPALNEALTAEVQRLKQIAGEASDPHVPNTSRKILEQQLQKQPPEAQLAEQQQPQESEEFKAQQKQWNH
jgi:hypothetical protein